jgi:signal transduction histidine kinase
LLARAEALTARQPYRRAGVMALITAGEALLFAVGLQRNRFPVSQLQWLLGNAAALGALLLISRWALRATPEERAPSRGFAAAFYGVLFGVGAVWGYFAFVVLGVVEVGPRASFNAFNIGAAPAVGALISLAVDPAALLAVSLPSVVPVSLALIRAGAYPFVGIGMLLFIGASLALSRRIRAGILRSHQLILINGHLKDEAEAQRARAERALAAKDRFLLATLHDLRQPVHALNLWAALPARLRPARALDANLSAMRGMVEGLADLARLEQGLLKPQSQRVGLDALCAQLERELSAHRPAPSFQGGGLVLRSDAALLGRLLRNLALNGLEHGRRVQLSAKRRGARACIEVRDDGPGLPPAARKLLQGQGGGALPSAKGLGVGLLVVRALAEALGAELRVGAGKGARIQVWLPLAEGV